MLTPLFGSILDFFEFQTLFNIAPPSVFKTPNLNFRLIWGFFKQKRGGGQQTKQKCLKFKFGHLKTHGGVSIFQKCLNYKLLSDPILKKQIKTLNLTLFNVNMPK